MTPDPEPRQSVADGDDAKRVTDLVRKARGKLSFPLGVLRLERPIKDSFIEDIGEALDCLDRILHGDNHEERIAAAKAGKPDPGYEPRSPSVADGGGDGRWRQAFCRCGKPVGPPASNCLAAREGEHSTVHDRWVVLESEATTLRDSLAAAEKRAEEAEADAKHAWEQEVEAANESYALEARLSSAEAEVERVTQAVEAAVRRYRNNHIGVADLVDRLRSILADTKESKG